MTKNNTHKVVAEPMVNLDESIKALIDRLFSHGDYKLLAEIVYGERSPKYSAKVEDIIMRRRGRKTAVEIISAFYRNRELFIKEVEKIKSGK